MKNVIKPTATRLLIPLGLAAPASATETAIYEKCLDMVVVLHTGT